MPRKGKTRAPVTPFTALIMLAGVFLCITGFLVAYLICVDRVAEFSNGYFYQNNWAPFRGGYLDYLMQLPRTLYLSLLHYSHACMISLIFFPLLIFMVPLYDMFFLHDYSAVFYGVTPFMIGAGLVLWSAFLQDTSRLPKVKPLEFDD